MSIANMTTVSTDFLKDSSLKGKGGWNKDLFSNYGNRVFRSQARVRSYRQRVTACHDERLNRNHVGILPFWKPHSPYEE